MKQEKISPNRDFEGEYLYFMEKGSTKVTATAVVKAVYNYAKLFEEKTAKIYADNWDKLHLLSRPKDRWHKNCLCLVEFEDALVGTSILADYEKSRFLQVKISRRIKFI